jgi:hypothetical protein
MGKLAHLSLRTGATAFQVKLPSASRWMSGGIASVLSRLDRPTILSFSRASGEGRSSLWHATEYSGKGESITAPQAGRVID